MLNVWCCGSWLVLHEKEQVHPVVIANRRARRAAAVLAVAALCSLWLRVILTQLVPLSSHLRAGTFSRETVSTLVA
jgi:hypothetical protein